MRLYRPVGLHELHLIYDTGMQAFPRRLADQPIFYPVLNHAYAAQIASAWNTKTSPYAGYVTEWEMSADYLAQFEAQVVGARMHAELWIPAEELPLFNQHIQAPIEVTAAYFGDGFLGYQPTSGALAGCTAQQQLTLLCEQFEHDPAIFLQTIRANTVAIYLHYRYWRGLVTQQTPSQPTEQHILDAIATQWATFSPKVKLLAEPTATPETLT